MSEIRFNEILALLNSAGVDCILIGGLAAIAHGTARATYDIDFVYSRHPDNIARLAQCLEPYKPYLRGVPLGLPFRFDVRTIQAGLNFTLTTTLGDVDFLGEVTGGGSFENLLPHTEKINVLKVPALCVTLEKLIDLKRAAGRPKDLEAIAELVALLEERTNRQ
jgi:hypothetical protein